MITKPKFLVLGALAVIFSTGAVRAQDATPQSDLLLATLWTQRSVEFKANARAAFALPRSRPAERRAAEKDRPRA